MVNARNPIFFKQLDTTRGVYQWAEFSGVGEWEESLEEEERALSTVRTANKTSATIVNFKKTLAIPVEFFEDEEHDVVNNAIAAVGLRGRTKQDKSALNVYAAGFATTSFTTPDGAALFSNSHTSLDGSTIDNLETGALTPDNFEILWRSLQGQKAQDNDLGGHEPVGFLVPPALYPDAIELLDSQLRPGTGNNQVNWVFTKYGTIVLGQNPYLGSTYNTATNANTSHYLVSRNHSISRITRLGMETKLVPPDTDLMDRYFYKARYREVDRPKSWEGIVASNGSV